jgi:hypothetical protein
MDIQDPIFIKEALAALRRRVRLNYERDMGAIDHVQHMLGQGGLEVDSMQMVFEETLRGIGMEDALEGYEGDRAQRAPLRKMTMISAIEQVFRTYPTTGWTVENLEIELRHGGFEFEAKNPKASINTTLARLIERGMVRVRERGVGRKPSVYLSVDPTPNASEQKRGAAKAA